MKTVLVILLCVLVMLQVRLWVGPGSIADLARLENEIVEQNQENDELQARNSGLMDEVSDLRNGLDSIEERARNELGLIRRGETFYLIVESDPNTRENGAPQLERVPELTPDSVMLEPAPELIVEDNPYLEIFRDEGEEGDQGDQEGAADPARAEGPQAPADGLAAGQ